MTIHQDTENTEAGRPSTAAEHQHTCSRCRAPLADDQRYCLNCGQRVSGAPLPFMNVLEQRARRAGGAQEAAPARWQPSPGLAAAGVAVLALAIGFGVLIGSAGDDQPRQVAAAAPQVITVQAGAATAAAQFTSDWPAGKDGYTVQLETLPKDGTEVSAVQSAKSDAQSQGATDVGALDSDDFSGLDGGNYVIYAGSFDSRKQAARALRKLKGDFPGAKVVHVSAGGVAQGGDAGALSGKKKSATVGKQQLEDLKKLSPDEYQKKAKKLPDETKLPGKAPPKDEKKPGAGTQGEEIG